MAVKKKAVRKPVHKPVTVPQPEPEMIRTPLILRKTEELTPKEIESCLPKEETPRIKPVRDDSFKGFGSKKWEEDNPGMYPIWSLEKNMEEKKAKGYENTGIWNGDQVLMFKPKDLKEIQNRRESEEADRRSAAYVGERLKTDAAEANFDVFKTDSSAKTSFFMENNPIGPQG